jgi:pilus assembly protein CpaC
MANSTLIRATLLVALILAFGFAATGTAPAADQSPLPVAKLDGTRPAQDRSPLGSVQLVAGDATSRFIPLGVSKSVVIELPRDIKDVLVADPGIVNIVMRSSRRAYIFGMKVGQTNVFFFDEEGKQIASLDMAVTRDLNGIHAALKRALPNADIKVDGIGDIGVMLSGAVADGAEARLANDLACKLLKTPTTIVSSGSSNIGAGGAVSNSSDTTTAGSDGCGGVVNALSILGRDQVMLKVTVAEVQRDIIKQLGVDLNGSLGSGTSLVGFQTINPFSALGEALSAAKTVDAKFKSVEATLRAMERAGVVRTLAEPTLTAISGENANFLAGGEFPIVTGTSGPPNFSPTVEFKKFGVSLNFTPVVLSQGRISLKVTTEVSELSTEGALQSGIFTIPSLRTRRADTTLEIPSGGSLAMAGLIQEQTKQQINGLPGLMEVPVLGTLFKSRDYVNRQTELMILVTPYVVRAVARKDLARPDDGFADASDPASVLLGRFNRIYGVAKTDPVKANPKAAYRGNYGFILD